MPSLFFVAFLAIASLQGTFGAPCNKDLGSCVTKCKAKTGWTHPMGKNTWGQPSSAVSSLSSGSTPAANVKGNPNDGNPSSPAPTPTTTTQPKPAPTPAGAVDSSTGTPASNSSSAVSSADITAYLSAHNTVRSQHGAKPLAWNETLSSAAQTWADGCKFAHSGGTLGPYGENLAAGTGDAYGIPQAIKSWTDEASEYDPKNPQFSHFTQVVWKSTTQVGCAVFDCGAGTVFPDAVGHYYVCEYFPQGNFIGQFPENVQA